MPSLNLARIVMLLKFENTTSDIAIQHATQQGDVVLFVWWQLYWRPPSLEMAEMYVGGIKHCVLEIQVPYDIQINTITFCSAWRSY